MRIQTRQFATLVILLTSLLLRLLHWRSKPRPVIGPGLLLRQPEANCQ